MNGHSKECRSFDVDLHCNTFKIRFWAVYTQAFGGAGAIAPEHAAAKLGHHPFFFVREKGGGGGVRPHPPNPPWLRAWSDRKSLKTRITVDCCNVQSCYCWRINEERLRQVLELAILQIPAERKRPMQKHFIKMQNSCCR